MEDSFKIRRVFSRVLHRPGAFVLVDGQYGSTGKGLAAAVLAETVGYLFDAVTSNAGPNSGHTSYYRGEKIVLQQLPTFGVVCNKAGATVPMYMNGGAVIDWPKLKEELDFYAGNAPVMVHPHAACVTDEARGMETEMVGRIGSTGKGTGAAIARKVLRIEGAVAQDHIPEQLLGMLHPFSDRFYFVEVSQGYSLSLNASGFYPYTTSRDCTVGQAMSDAGLHPETYIGGMMVVRTFPIRVAGNSGPCYPDQRETSWEEIGQAPEITTVTKKVRRVFTWSDQQFIDALRANRPTMLFFNFINYLPEEKRETFILDKLRFYRMVMQRNPDLVLTGHGPYSHQVRVYDV